MSDQPSLVDKLEAEQSKTELRSTLSPWGQQVAERVLELRDGLQHVDPSHAGASRRICSTRPSGLPSNACRSGDGSRGCRTGGSAVASSGRGPCCTRAKCCSSSTPTNGAWRSRSTTRVGLRGGRCRPTIPCACGSRRCAVARDDDANGGKAVEPASMPRRCRSPRDDDRRPEDVERTMVQVGATPFVRADRRVPS